MPEYRITRPNEYKNVDTGREDKSARQGYYVTAETFEDAMKLARHIYKIISPDEPLDWEFWGNKKCDHTGKRLAVGVVKGKQQEQCCVCGFYMQIKEPYAPPSVTSIQLPTKIPEIW